MDYAGGGVVNLAESNKTCNLTANASRLTRTSNTALFSWKSAQRDLVLLILSDVMDLALALTSTST